MRLSINSEITKSRMSLNILENIRKIPGRLMLIPMGIAAVINTFIPNAMQIGNHASTAICCVAGLSIAVPKLMAEVDASYLPYMESATSQIAFVVVISTVITPILVKRLSK